MNFSIIVNKSEVLTLSLCIFVFPAGFHYLPYHFDRSGQFKEKSSTPPSGEMELAGRVTIADFPLLGRIAFNFSAKATFIRLFCQKLIESKKLA